MDSKDTVIKHIKGRRMLTYAHQELVMHSLSLSSVGMEKLSQEIAKLADDIALAEKLTDEAFDEMLDIAVTSTAHSEVLGMKLDLHHKMEEKK